MSTTVAVVMLFAAVVSLCLPLVGCTSDPFQLQVDPANGAYELVSIDGAPLPTQNVVEGGIALLDRTFTMQEVSAIRYPSGGYTALLWTGTGEYKFSNNGVLTFVAGEGNGTRLLRRIEPDEWAGEHHGMWFGILSGDVLQLWDGGTTVREYRRPGDDN